MEWALILAIVAIILTVAIAILRSQGSKKHRMLLEQQLVNQREELGMMRELIESFNRLTVSYDNELGSMRNQLLLTSGQVKDGDTVASEVELEKAKQKTEKKLQKEESKRIKKLMKALEKDENS
jgi:hypothetical protein